MTTKEFRERKAKAAKCPYGINFFGTIFCMRFLESAKEIQHPKDLKKFPLCLDLSMCSDEKYKQDLNQSIKEKKEMAKNFANAGSAKTIKEVEKASAQKAQVLVVKMISNSNLIDYPHNGEDVKDTADLENSIKELGFTDPIEVTAYGQSEGNYMIVSGHRRRTAGVKCGLDVFPCIVKSFNSESEVANYVLLANSQRDSAKDPLLFCKRYKMHEEYLKSANFNGNVREEIAKRLGISVQQADRYNAMNRIILPVWDMVRNEKVGMSSVIPLASHNEQEQGEIFAVMKEALQNKNTLTRDDVKNIVDGYRKDKKSWAEIERSKAETPQEHNPITAAEEIVQVLEETTQETQERNPIAVEEEEQEEETAQEQAPLEEKEKEKKPPMSEEEKQVKRGQDILKSVEKLNTCFSEIYSFEGWREAQEAVRNLTSLIDVVVDEIYHITREHEKKMEFENTLSLLKGKLREYGE